MNEWMQSLADFHFLRPHWLWAMIPLVLIGGLLTYLSKQQSGWQSVLAGHLYKHIISHAQGKKYKQPFWLLICGWLIATVALAGPTWQRLPQPVYQLHTGKVVLLDMSMSMRATDVKPNRLARAKYKAIDLVKQISEGETGLVAYAGDAFTISPLSTDGQNLTTLIPSLSPEIMPIAGSEPALGLRSAIDLLKNAGYQQGEIFWITDGVENQQMPEITRLLNDSPYRLSILVIGTEEGAPIQMVDGELLKDANGAIVLPKVNVANLKTLARQGGGRYAPMQADDSDIDYLVQQGRLGTETDENQDPASNDDFGDKWQEMGPYLLLLILPFAAYSFRRGMLSMLTVGMILPLLSPNADAGWWQDMWKNNNQQGYEAYQQQQFDSAAQKFDDPLWLGASLYRQQDYENALKAFEQSDSIEGRYNQANTLAQLGQLQPAIKKYEEVLAEQADFADAQANKELLEKLLQQQQEQKDQQDQQNSSDNQQNNQDQQSQQDKQDQQNSDQQQSAQQQGQQDQQDQQNQQQDQSQQQQGDSESEQNNQPEQQEDSSQPNQDEQQEQQQQQEASHDPNQDPQNPQQAAEAAQAQQQEMTDEQKEQMQRMQNLLNRVPDDPAFLLKRKMQLEAQQRKRERVPSNVQRNW